VQALSLGLGCGEQCGGTVDLTPLLKDKTGWQTLSIDLPCFKGTDFGKVQQSFVLSSKAANKVQLSDIRLVPGMAGKASLSCQ
jgi:beta-glucosidase